MNRPFISLLLISLLLCKNVAYSAESNPLSAETLKQNPAIFIPVEQGHIEESSRGHLGKTVIYIQDAHDSLEAQENIAKIIHSLVERYGVNTVYEEGHEGMVPTDKYFGAIRDPRTREKTAYFLMDKLRLGGAEYAHITRVKDFQLIGADNLNLHKKNIQKYQESVRFREETKKDLAKLNTEIRELAQRYFPKPLIEWMGMKERFDRQEIDLLDYLKRSFPSREGGGPSISLLLAAGKKEARMDALHSMDAKALFREINELEDLYAGTHLKVPRDQEIFRYYKLIQLIKRLNAIEVTEEEYGVVKESLKAINTQKVAEFLSVEKQKSILLSKTWESRIQSAIGFYETARERDSSILNRLEEYRKSPGQEPIVLVYGGFHKDSIKALLKKGGFSYSIVTPKITFVSLKHQEYYRQLMMIGYDSMALPNLAAKAARAPDLLTLALKDAKTESLVKGLIIKIARIANERKDFYEMDLAWSRDQFKLERAQKNMVSRAEMRALDREDGWLSEAIRNTEYQDAQTRDVTLKTVFENLPALKRILRNNKLLAVGLKERLTDEESALDILLEHVKDQIFTVPLKTGINLVMISFPMATLNDISKQYLPGFSDAFKKRFHQKLISEYHMDAAIFGTRIVIANYDPFQAQKQLFKIISEIEDENQLVIKQLSSEKKKGVKELFKGVTKNIYISHVELFLKEPSSEPIFSDPADIPRYMEEENLLRQPEITPRDFEAMPKHTQKAFFVASDAKQMQLRRKWSLSGGYWLDKTRHADLPEERFTARGKANFFIERLLHDAIARLYERGEVLEKATGDLREKMDVLMAEQSGGKNAVTPILNQIFVKHLTEKFRDDPILPKFYEALQEGRRASPPIFEYQQKGLPGMAGMPRRGRILANLDVRIKNLGKALRELEMSQTALVLDHFKEKYRDYQLAWYEALVLAYRDPRLEQYYKRERITEIARADELGLLTHLKERLLTFAMNSPKEEISERFKRLADLIEPGLLPYKRPVGDEVWFAVKENHGRYGVAFSELNQGRGFFLFNPPDAQDSTLHRILLSYLDLIKQHRARNVEPWWTFLEQFDSGIRPLAPGLYPTKVKVPFEGTVERMDAFVLKGDKSSRSPTYVRDRDGNFLDLSTGNKTDKVGLGDLQRFETFLTSARNYESQGVHAAQIEHVSDELDSLVQIQKENPVLIHEVVSAEALRTLAGKAKRSEVRLIQDELSATLDQTIQLQSDVVFTIRQETLDQLARAKETGQPDQWLELLGLKMLNEDKLHIVIDSEEDQSLGARASELLWNHKNVYLGWGARTLVRLPKNVPVIQFEKLMNGQLSGELLKEGSLRQISATFDVFNGAFLAALRYAQNSNRLEELPNQSRPVITSATALDMGLLDQLFKAYAVISRAA